MGEKLMAEKNVQHPEQGMVINLDAIDYEPVVLRMGGADYTMDKFTAADQIELETLERAVNTGGFGPIMDFWKRKFAVPAEVWGGMNMALYTDFREQIVPAILFGKKKPKK